MGHGAAKVVMTWLQLLLSVGIATTSQVFQAESIRLHQSACLHAASLWHAVFHLSCAAREAGLAAQPS